MDHEQLTEKEMIVLLKKRDLPAFSILYDQYAPAFYSSILRLVPGSEASEQILVKVFQRIWDEVTTLNPSRDHFFPWMYSILQQEIGYWHEQHSAT